MKNCLFGHGNPHKKVRPCEPVWTFCLQWKQEIIISGAILVNLMIYVRVCCFFCYYCFFHNEEGHDQDEKKNEIFFKVKIVSFKAAGGLSLVMLKGQSSRCY